MVGVVGGGYTMMNDFPTARRNTPRTTPASTIAPWDFKATGSYDAPWGIRLSPVFRHQSGANYARTVTISAPGGPDGATRSTTAYAEATDCATAKTTSGCSTFAPRSS